MIHELVPTLAPGSANLIVEAERCCAGLDRVSGVSMMELALFLLRSESVASSKIERLDAPSQQVFEVLAGVRGARNTAGLIAANIQAMQRAVELGASEARFGLEQILEIHRVLLRDDPVEQDWAGRLRTQQNWIGGSDDCPRGAVFVPPRPELAPALLDDMFRFMRRTDIPPTVQAAIVHAQFETIHPFTDGNGRVGRALIHVILRRRAAVERTLVPVSTVLLSEPERYFAALTKYRDGDLDAWVSDFARAIITATREGEVLAQRLLEMRSAWLDAVRPRKNSAAATILEGLIQQPVITIDTARSMCEGVADKNIHLAIDKLAGAGVLAPITSQRRNRAWMAPDVLDLLEQFQKEVSKRRRVTKRSRR